MHAYLTDDLWCDMARQANAACARLAAGLRQHDPAQLLFEPQANMIFFAMPRAEHQRMMAGGATYYIMDGDLETGPADQMLTGRLVCDWSMEEAVIDNFLDLLRG